MKQPSLLKNTTWRWDHLALLLLLTLLCYWPLSFGIFSAKNDNIVQFLPVRFQVSEALRNGHLPLWSPYMYLGYPIHGDMQGGAWNPLVWLISAFGRYNLTSLHVEILVYIFLGGAGMYRLLRSCGLQTRWQLAGAAAYLMCGYITDVGGSNAPFLAVVTYIPFVMAYFKELLSTLSAGYVFKTAVSLALLFVSGYPSFFIITCYILGTGWLVVLIRTRLQHQPILFKRQAKLVAGAALLFLGLCAPAILSYAQILPYYQRGSGVGLAGALQNSFHPWCSLSFVLPSLPERISAAFTTDLISRNAYFNSFFLVLALSYAWARKRVVLSFALAGMLFFFLFSLGPATPVRGWCYHLLPLMNTFRHPSNARLFVIIAGIVMGASIGQQAFSLSGAYVRKYTGLACLLLAGVLLLACFFGLMQPVSLFEKFRMAFQSADVRKALRDFFDLTNSRDLILINGLLQVLFLSAFAFILLKKKAKFLIPLFLLNSFLFAQLSIPYTLVSKLPPRALNDLLRSYPKGYPSPSPELSIGDASIHSLDHFDTLGITSFYGKEIATTSVAFTPTFMTPIEELQKDTGMMRLVLANPYAYLASAIYDAPTVVPRAIASTDRSLPPLPLGKGVLKLDKLWNNGFHFTTGSKENTVLCLQQLYLPGWTCTIDGNDIIPARANGAFMAVPLKPGRHQVGFVYRPGGIAIWIAMVLSFLSFVFVLIQIKKYRGGKNIYQG